MLGRARRGRIGKGSRHGRRGLYMASRAAEARGRPDSEIVFKIKQHLRKVHQIPAAQIKTEHAIRIYGDGGVVLGPADRRKLSRIRGLVHTPDIVVTDGAGNIRFVIEQDGRAHESEKMTEKDVARNRHYAAAGIPCIVLSTRAIRSAGVTGRRVPGPGDVKDPRRYQGLRYRMIGEPLRWPPGQGNTGCPVDWVRRGYGRFRIAGSFLSEPDGFLCFTSHPVLDVVVDDKVQFLVREVVMLG